MSEWESICSGNILNHRIPGYPSSAIECYLASTPNKVMNANDLSSTTLFFHYLWT